HCADGGADPDAATGRRLRALDARRARPQARSGRVGCAVERGADGGRETVHGRGPVLPARVPVPRVLRLLHRPARGGGARSRSASAPPHRLRDGGGRSVASRSGAAPREDVPGRLTHHFPLSSGYRKHETTWSLTIPTACMKAYAPVGPKNWKPRRTSSLLIRS